MSKTALDNEGIQRELDWLYEHPELDIAVDTETTGFRVAGDDYPIGVSLAAVGADRTCSIYVPVQHAVGTNVDEETREQMRNILASQKRRLIFANCQFDMLALESIGIRTEHQDFYDIIVMAHLLDENTPRSKGLDSLAKHYLGVETGKVKNAFIEKEKRTGWKNTTPEMMWEYATTDTELTWRVHKKLRPAFEKLPGWIWPHKQALVRVLLQMRRRGIRIDRALAEQMVAAGEERMVDAKSRMGLAPADPVGPKALFRILHEELEVPILHKSKITGKPSYDKVAMADYDDLLEEKHSPVGKALKEFRGWQKSSSAAYAPYLRLMDSDGRLRCGYKLHGTTTGRLSCAEPNLQQIPKESTKEWNGRVKECFIAADGYTLVNADFSQLELRLATAYAPDPKLVAVFAEGRDIFTEMTAQLVSTMPAGWSRQDTKTLVYSMQYGAGVNRVMQAFHVDEATAKAIISNYKNTYPMFSLLNRKCTEMAEDRLQINMWSGRTRRFQYKSEGYKAMNAMIQGGAADIVERIMVRLFNEVDSDAECRMLLQVHDSVTFEVRSDLVSQYIPRIRSVMEDVDAVLGFESGVRFAVDITPWSAVEAAKWPQEEQVAA